MAENAPPTSTIPLVPEDPSDGSDEEPLSCALSKKKAPILSTPRQQKSRGPEVLTSSPKANGAKKRKQYRNGYESAPKTPSYTPYSLRISSGRKRLSAFKFPGAETAAVRPGKPLSSEEWTALAQKAGWIPQDAVVREFQGHVSNLVLGQEDDVAVIAPTGHGKSLLWCLPLGVDETAVSLVITPYTSLGIEGATRTTKLGIKSVFIYEGLKGEDVLERAARGDFRVIFACPEMVESPRFGQILHCETFKPLLQAVYIDEAHSVYESHDWRPAYSRISGLRRALGRNVPIVAMSATLPSAYRAALVKHVGFREDHVLVNLGNHRPELSLAVLPLKYPKTSFQDLAFTLPWGIAADAIPVTLIYCDDIDLLTRMFWWFQRRLQEMGLPSHLVDILHAGLSDSHEAISMDAFRAHLTRILLTTEKVGAGINFRGVRRMIQYLLKNLTPARLDQRRGRMARDGDITGVAFLFIEEELLSDDDVHSSKSTDAIDDGILTLVRTKGCYQEALDALLENPPRPQPRAAATALPCCSHCNPELKPSQEFQMIAVDPSVGSRQSVLKASEHEAIFRELYACRALTWAEDWGTKWRSLGEQDLLSDAALYSISKVADTIESIDDLRGVATIAYWSVVAPWVVHTTRRIAHQVLEEGLGSLPTRENASQAAAAYAAQKKSRSQAVTTASKDN